MKITTVLVSALILSAMLMAPVSRAEEGKYFVNLGPLVSFPTGNFSRAANTGVGVTASVIYEYNPHIDYLGNIGYIRWGGKTNNSDFTDYPLQGGATYYLSTSATRFYVGGLFGLHFFRNTLKITDPFTGFRQSVTNNSTEVGIAPLIGYQSDLNTRVTLDAQAQYEIISGNHSNVGLRASLNYRIR